MYIKYSDSDTQFIENHSNTTTVDGEEYFFFPYVLKKIKDGVFEVMDFRALPQPVKDVVNRAESTKPEENRNWRFKNR